jgi:hypothetical protein
MANQTTDQCEMIIGYLVPHRCEHPLVDSSSGKICLADQQGLDQPIALPLTAATFSQRDIEVFNRASMYDDDDKSGDMFSDLS